LIVNIFNLNQYTTIILLSFAAMAMLGAIDDILNIYGKPRKFRTFERTLKLVRIHRVIWKRVAYFFTLPWVAYQSAIHVFESNPGSGLRAHEKVLVQTFVGLIFGYWIYKFMGSMFWLPFVGSIDIGWLIIPFAAFTFVSTTNAVNISDGLDGLSSGMMAIALSGFMVIAFLIGKFEMTLLIATVVGALVTYLYFNIPPARIQLGDTGAFALGAFLAMAGFGIGKPLLIPVIGFLFVVEVGSTILQSFSRRIFGRRILQMAPLHHHFEMIGWKEEKVVMRFWIATIICTIIGLWLSFF
jgi:phospho-N-acetylmuramoyl-pentapeptide-transferase